MATRHYESRAFYHPGPGNSVRFLSIEPLLEDLGEINLEGIHWVIVWGESGPGARPVQEQCERAAIPFFFKQWGGVRKSKTGREIDGRTFDGLPDRVALPVLENHQRLAAIADVERQFQAIAETPLETSLTHDG